MLVDVAADDFGVGAAGQNDFPGDDQKGGASKREIAPFVDAADKSSNETTAPMKAVRHTPVRMRHSRSTERRDQRYNHNLIQE